MGIGLKTAGFLTITTLCLLLLNAQRQHASADSQALKKIRGLEAQLETERRAVAALRSELQTQTSLARSRLQQAQAQQAQAQQAQAQEARAQQPCPRPHIEQSQPADSLPTLEAVRAASRAEMREELVRAAARAAAGGSAIGEAERLSAQAELARHEAREARAAEEPGWCSCPAPPDLAQLCGALAPASSWEREAHRARAEADALRAAALEANLRADAASEASTLLRVRAEVSG